MDVNASPRLWLARALALASRGELGEFKNQVATTRTVAARSHSTFQQSRDLHLVLLLVSLSILAIATVCLTGHIHGHIILVTGLALRLYILA